MAAKRIKAQPIETAAEFRAVVNQIAEAQAEHVAISARRDRAVQRIQARYAEKLAPIDAEIVAKIERADAYAEAHRAELLPKDKKSFTLACATCGWRTGNRTVKITPKTIEEAAVIAALKEHNLGNYVRSVETIDKAKILTDCKDDLTLPVQFPSSEDENPPVALADLHLKISQSETFYIEPAVETGETIKPEEAPKS